MRQENPDPDKLIESYREDNIKLSMYLNDLERDYMNLKVRKELGIFRKNLKEFSRIMRQ
jgi:hypothetical protein